MTLYLGSRAHPDRVNTAEDAGSKLRPERDLGWRIAGVEARGCYPVSAYPNSVLDLCGRRAIVVLRRVLDGDALLTIDRLARHQIHGGYNRVSLNYDKQYPCYRGNIPC